MSSGKMWCVEVSGVEVFCRPLAEAVVDNVDSRYEIEKERMETGKVR